MFICGCLRRFRSEARTATIFLSSAWLLLLLVEEDARDSMVRNLLKHLTKAIVEKMAAGRKADLWTEEKDRRRCALINRSLLAELTVVEQHELSQLQKQAEAHFDEFARPPIAGALRIHAQLLKIASPTNK